MNNGIEHRLNLIVDRLVSAELLSNSGLGNEIGFYVFDYPPDFEPQVRDFLKTIENQLSKRKPDLKVAHVNLFKLLIEYLKERKLLERAFVLQKKDGDEGLLKALKAPLNEEKIAKYFVSITKPEENDLIILSGIGSSFPILRSHTLLNNLHHRMNDKPLVIFFPGQYDGQGLRLFGKLKESNYYRAFRLVS